jgi:hypothetical protein
MRRRQTRLVIAAVLAAQCAGLVLPRHTLSPKAAAPSTRRSAPLYAQVDEELQETVEKSGVEGGLFSIFTGDGDAKEKATTAGDLLKQYGGAYLLTSTSFAIVSFAICYTLVSNGVDVAGLLGKIGIEPSQNAQTGGTFAIAYAAHKAASPIRFPPTVALTPVVAKMLGKGDGEAEPEEEDA